MKYYFGLLLICFSLACSKQPLSQNEVEPALIPTDLAVYIGELSNGLTYYIMPNAKPAEKIELRLVIKAGSVLEEDNQQGLAHFMEHMNFNGTVHFEANQLVNYLQTKGVRFGAHLNAYTSFDETVYILPIPSKDKQLVDTAFQILGDWANGALLTEEEINKERGVVLEEYRIGLGAEKRLQPYYLPELLHKSKYAERLPIGKKEVIEQFEPDELRRFYTTWYRPNLMAVVVVGDIDVDYAKQKIEQQFGAMENPELAKERDQFSVQNHDETFVKVLSDEEYTNSRIDISYKDSSAVKPLNTVEQYKAVLKQRLFTRMLNLRLDEYRNSYEPPFLTAASQYGNLITRNKNAFQGFVLTEVGKEQEGLSVLLTEYERIKRFGFAEAELQNARKSILSRIEKRYVNRNKQESAALARRFVNHFLTQNAIPSIQWQYEAHKQFLPQISIDEINKLAHTLITEDNRMIIVKTPPQEHPIQEQEIRNILASIPQKDVQPYVFNPPASSLMKTLPQPGEISSETYNEKLDLTKIILSNGLTVYLKKTDFEDDEILVWANSYGGTSLFTNQESLQTELAIQGLTEAGVNGFTKNELTKMASGKNAYVSPYISTIGEGFRGETIPADLEYFLQYVHAYFTGLNQNKEAYNAFQRKQKALLENQLKNPRTYFFSELNKLVNAGNPRFIGFPSEQDWQATNYSLAYSKYKERFADASDFNFFFVGNIDLERTKTLITHYLGSLPTTNSNENFVVPTFRPKLSGFLEVKKGKEEQAYNVISYSKEVPYNQFESLQLNALAQIVQIKLTEVLREEQSGVYGVSCNAGLNKLPYSNFIFRITFSCAPENAELLRQITQEELQHILVDGPTPTDVEKVKKAMLESIRIASQRNGYWISNLSTSVFNKEDIHNVLEREALINELSVENIKALAQRYLNTAPFIAVLLPEE